jgi:hypothetical protein
MGSAGFTSPGVLFAGNSSAPERRFIRSVLGPLRSRGYTRLVEPCAGAFALSLAATDVGWDPRVIESSDVSLYAGVLGAVLDGDPLEKLDVRVDGEPVDLPGASDTTQAAFLLRLQLQLRLEAKPDVPYWANLVAEVRDHPQSFETQIETHLVKLQSRLRGLTYESLDMFEHADRVADDPNTVIVAAPPTYTAGFEKFYNTKGRLTWAEPTYRIFDPKTGFHDYLEQLSGKAALLIMCHETNSGQACGKALFARPGVPGRTGYVVSNRPEEILAITGGPKVDPKYSAPITPASVPAIPPDHEITVDSSIAVVATSTEVAEYYRRLWMHRLAEASSSGNALLLIDGYVAGVFGMSVDTITQPYNPDAAPSRKLLLRYGLGPRHKLRLTRLVTMVALQQSTARLVLNRPTVGLIVEASTGVVTANYSRLPEAKQQRGLMKRLSKKPHPDGWNLIYIADWRKPAQLPEVLAEFLKKEETWRKARMTR